MSPLADACLYRGAAPRCEATGCCCTPACGGAGCAFWRCRLPGRSSYTPRVPGCALRGSLRPRRLSRLLLLVLAPRHCLRLVVVGQIRLGRAAPGRTAQRIPRPSSLLLHDSPLSLSIYAPPSTGLLPLSSSHSTRVVVVVVVLASPRSWRPTHSLAPRTTHTLNFSASAPSLCLSRLAPASPLRHSLGPPRAPSVLCISVPSLLVRE